MSTEQDRGLIALFGGSEAGRLTGVMMEAGFQAAGLDYRFANIPVDDDKMEEVLRAAETFHMKGFNLDGSCTTEIVPYMDLMSPAASITGEVNSVRVQDGMYIGENSIGKGLVSCLMETGFSVQGRKICLLGSGRAAKAAAVECALSGAGQIIIICRNKEEGERIAFLTSSQTDAAVLVEKWEGRASIPAGTDALVNCTPLGLTEDDLPDLDYGQINGEITACDMVLGRPDTAFLQECRKRGAVTVAGIDIMAAQASLNFFLWTEAMFPRTLMKEVLLEELTGREAVPQEQNRQENDLSGDDPLIWKMLTCFKGEPGRIQHFLKVYEYAGMIGRREGLDQDSMDVVCTAAILWDLTGEAGSAADRPERMTAVLAKTAHGGEGDRKKEAAAAAEAMLRELDYEDLVIDRVLFLITGDRQDQAGDDPDRQVLLEARRLVELYENQCPEEMLEQARQNVIRTESGRLLLDLLYPEQ